MSPRIIADVADAINTNIPTTASIVTEVINIIHDSKSNASDLADVIEKDPTVSAKVLSISNSALYGSNAPINSIKRAVVIIGFEAIKEIVTTTLLLHYFFDPELREELDRPGLWIHSVGTAHASKLIAKWLNIDRPDVAYTAGLLHDIGKVLLVNFFFKRYSKIVRLAVEKNCRIILAERKILKSDHTKVGEVLCKAWSLPADITAVILFHHAPMEADDGFRKLASIVHLGDIMCRMVNLGNPCDNVIPESSRAALSLLGSSSKAITDNFNIILNNFEGLKPGIEEFFSQLETNSKTNQEK